MAIWKWRTLADERVEVDRLDGSGFSAEGLLDHPGVRQTAERVIQWTELAAKYAEKYDVPISWILAIIMAESGGDPQAENYCCAGLMAIYYSVHGKKREDMLDPDKNVDYGTSLLSKARKAGHDLPSTASIHVAGAERPYNPHPSTKSPYGMREHLWLDRPGGDGSVGYIDRVVRASNYWIERLGAAPHKPPPDLPTPKRAGMLKTSLQFLGGAAVGFGATVLLLPRLPAAKR